MLPSRVLTVICLCVWAELGLVHRHEKSGQLHGLMRVRCFTQDDAHIFMTPEQIKDEIMGVAKLINEVTPCLASNIM